MYLRPHRELNAKATAAVFLLLLATFSTVQAEVIAGRVVGVSDGDSITVLDTYKVQHKIRLAGIDAPEKAQAFGNRSKESLSDLVFSKTVTVETDKKDRYGRSVGKVLIDGKDANLLQVERGFAWHYKAYESEQSPSDRMLYDLAEREARAARRGLWRDSDPMAPWDFRKEKRRE
jgi:endonuclease YncB( thermonuclease family)